MNLDKMDLKELKGLAYDYIRRINLMQRDLNMIQSEIDKKERMPKNEPKPGESETPKE